MYSILVLLVNILVIFNVFCKNVQHRDPRFIRGTYTINFTHTVRVTKSIPSSCVQVDATLPPCRNVRFMRFPTFNSNQMANDDARPQPKSNPTDPPIYTTQLGWGEYFGIYAPTATVNITTIETATVLDPRVVVTYAVKGCRPMKLPRDLNRCPPDYSTLPIREVMPTSTVAPITPTKTESPVTPINTKVIDLAAAPDYGFQNVNEIQANEKSLQGSLAGTTGSNSFDVPVPTQPLP